MLSISVFMRSVLVVVLPSTFSRCSIFCEKEAVSILGEVETMGAESVFVLGDEHPASKRTITVLRYAVFFILKRYQNNCFLSSREVIGAKTVS